MRQLLSATVIFLMIGICDAQSPNDREWWFWPDYTLEGNAKNEIGPRLLPPISPVHPVTGTTYPLLFFGQEPNERLVDFYPSDSVTTKAFSVEMWILYHVNQEVGVVSTYRPKHLEKDPVWLLGLNGREVIFSLDDTSTDFSSVLNYTLEKRGWKNYWLHLTASYDGQEAKLFVNGDLQGKMKVGAIREFDQTAYQLELAAYLTKEPYMQMGDLLKCLKLSDYAISPQEVKEHYNYFQSLVESGHLYPDLFHFTAGPYLQRVTQDQIGMVWETSEPSNTIIEYGTNLPLTEKVSIENLSLNTEINAYKGASIQKYLLDDLEPGQQYFYNIKSTSASGEVIESGISTFKTAAEYLPTFSFSVIGDTEARPHVNNRVSKLLWDERPDFLLNLGDLTDGGRKPNKYQWNYEYFYGMNQLISRVPVFPVAGNGEGDLFWFNKYHILSNNDKAYYKFSYGNADFFMLDSNQKDQFAAGGEQYEWLEKELESSTADWKFVAHHHAPYSSDEDDYGNSWEGTSTQGDMKIRQIVPLYEKYGVDMVFFGHLHTFQRTHAIKDNQVTKDGGVVYIHAGGAGGNLEDFSPTRSWFSAKTFRGHHYLTVEVFGQEVELRMYDSEGRLKDFFTLKK